METNSFDSELKRIETLQEERRLKSEDFGGVMGSAF